MRKLITIILILVCSKSFAQVYQLMPQYGYQANRMVFDSTLQIPTTCGVPTLKSVQFVTKRAAIAFDSCNNRFYQYNPKTLAWSVVSGSGGSTDTTSLSNRIDAKIDSIKRRNDSVFAYKLGVAYFQFKDSIGGGGSTPTLNQVLAAGSVGTDKDITLNDADLGHQISIAVNQTYPTLQMTSNNATTNTFVFQSSGANNLSSITSVIDDGVNPSTTQQLVLGTSDGSVFMPFNDRASDTLATLYNLRNSGTAIDTANQFVNSVTKVNDSTIRVIKGTSTTDITITTSSIVTAATRLVTSVYNNSGSTIVKGSVVYINGRHSSNLPTIALAQANNEENSYKTFALVSDDIADNASGLVIQAGNIAGLNLPTSTYTDGDIVYLSPSSAGGLTITKPLAPNHICKIGSVTRAHPTQGSIEIKIENGLQLDELSDVSIPLVPADSVVLQFSRVDSLWHDVSISNAIGSRYIKPSDTSVFARKSVPANTINANNTNAVANESALTFKQFGNQTYSDSITITGASNPSGAINHSFRWSQIGNLVTLHITLTYATNGSLSQVAMELPDGLPLPILPTGLTANNDIICYGSGFMVSTTTGVATFFSKVFLRQNTGLTNDYEIVINQASNSSYRIMNATIQYFAQ